MKGQITVEFLIILAVMTLLFSSISLDLSNYALKNALVTQSEVLASEANSVLVGAFNQVYLQGSGASKTVSIRAPADCNFTVNPTNVGVTCRFLSFTQQNYSTGFPAFADISAYSGIGVTYNCIGCDGAANNVIPSGSARFVQVKKA